MNCLLCTDPKGKLFITGTFANSEDSDEMLHKAAFHQDLHGLLRLKCSSGTEVLHSIEILTSNP